MKLLTEKPYYIDSSTAIVIITFNLYEPTSDRFITT
jgi:hypothetical protein